MANDATRIRPFSANVRRQPGGAVIDLHGEMDSFADAALAAAFAEASEGKPPRIALNFGDVDYINSTGIALIVGVLSQARQAEIPLAAFGLSEHYREIFDITRLSDFMTICADERSALA
jgi:anti-anti-sigma factor